MKALRSLAARGSRRLEIGDVADVAALDGDPAPACRTIIADAYPGARHVREITAADNQILNDDARHLLDVDDASLAACTGNERGLPCPVAADGEGARLQAIAVDVGNEIADESVAAIEQHGAAARQEKRIHLGDGLQRCGGRLAVIGIVAIGSDIDCFRRDGGRQGKVDCVV